MTDMPAPTALLLAYDTQLRARDRTGTAEWDGPLLRSTGPHGGFIGYRDLGGLDGPELDALIAQQVDFFAARGERFEWKHHSHDLPADLPQRLSAAGFVAQERETVLIGAAAPLASPAPDLPDGVRIRRTTDAADFAAIEALNGVVWGTELGWLADMLAEESVNEHFGVWVAEAGGQVVSAAWLRGVPGTDFAGLWGGATLAEYRGRGIYKALVGVRAAVALELGHPYLQVDASEDSRPILQRLGFVAVTHTTPYVWEPAQA